MQALTDAHSGNFGDYDALVIVQLAGFSEGGLLLFERLQMTPMARGVTWENILEKA